MSRKMSATIWSVFLFAFAPLAVESSLDSGNIRKMIDFSETMIETMEGAPGSRVRRHEDSPLDQLNQVIRKSVLAIKEIEDQCRPESFKETYKRHHLLNSGQEVEQCMKDLEGPVGTVKELWTYFSGCILDLEKSCDKLEELALNITTETDNIFQQLVDSIYTVMNLNPTEKRGNSFPLLLYHELKINKDVLCDLFVPPSEFLYDMFQTIEVTELKAHTMILYGYKFREILQSTDNKEVFVNKRAVQHKRFKERLLEYADIFKRTIYSTSRYLRRCDIPIQNYTRGDTFLEFERFINTIIVEEPALSPIRRCDDTCDKIATPKIFMVGEDPNDPCKDGNCTWPSEICDGSLLDCEFIGWRIDLCENKNVSEPRRYDWFVNQKRMVHGDHSKGCKNPLQRAKWIQPSLNINCETCACTCIEDNPLKMNRTSRRISLVDVVSDTVQNMIVTGVKFIQNEGVIQIKIQTGKLIGYSRVNDTTVKWQEPENPDRIFEFTSKNRKINLDKLQVPEENVVTGIRFAKVEQGGPGEYAIGLEIRATPFDRKTGKLLVDDEKWITPEANEEDNEYNIPRQQIVQPSDLKNPLTVSKTRPDFTPNKWIQLDKTGLVEDAGQTVIPLLDGTEVSALPAVPLAGISLFHKAAEGCGGFLSFQIITIDRSDDIIIPPE